MSENGMTESNRPAAGVKETEGAATLFELAPEEIEVCLRLRGPAGRHELVHYLRPPGYEDWREYERNLRSTVESVESDFHQRSLARTDPEEAIAGPNSMPFILAIALLDGKVTLEQFTDENIHDPRVRAAMAKVRHRANQRQPGQAEAPDRITVTLKNGAVHTIEVAFDRTRPRDAVDHGEQQRQENSEQ